MAKCREFYIDITDENNCFNEQVLIDHKVLVSLNYW